VGGSVVSRGEFIFTISEGNTAPPDQDRFDLRAQRSLRISLEGVVRETGANPFEDLVRRRGPDIGAEERRFERFVVLVSQVAAVLKDRGDLSEEGVAGLRQTLGDLAEEIHETILRLG